MSTSLCMLRWGYERTPRRRDEPLLLATSRNLVEFLHILLRQRLKSRECSVVVCADTGGGDRFGEDDDVFLHYKV